MPEAECWRASGVFGDATCERLAQVAHCRNCARYSRAGRGLLDREIPSGTREEAAELLAMPRETAASDTLSVAAFRIGTQWLALDTVLFERWFEARPVHVVPGKTNEVFRGLVNVDGELLLAFDGARMLGSGETSSDPSRMFVAAKGSDRFVFAVDEVLGIRRIPKKALEEVPATVARSASTLTRNVVRIEDRALALLDPEKFFGCAVRSLS